MSSYHHKNLRQALLDRAVAVLSSAGIEKLSLRALARELGVSHAAPLRHFQTKADLLCTIAIEGAQSMLRVVQDAQNLPAGQARLLGISTAYIEWAMQNPAYYQVLRNLDVMRHAPERLGQLLSEFAQGQRREIEIAQSSGWRSSEDSEVLFLHLTALTVGSAIVATDPIYAKPSGVGLSRERLVSSIELFLNMKPQTC